MAPASAFLAPPHALPTRERALRPSPVRPLVTPLLPVATAASSPSDRPRERGRPEQRGRRAGGRSNDPGAHRRNRRATMSAPPVPRVEDVLVGGGIAVAGVVAATAMGGAADAIHSLPAVGDSFELVGAAYTLWFMRRFLSSNLGRQELATTLRSISPPPAATPAARRSTSTPPPRRWQRSRSAAQPGSSPVVSTGYGVSSTQPAAPVSGQAPSVAAGNGVFMTDRSGSLGPPSAVSRSARAHAARMAVRARRAPPAVAPKTVTLKSTVPGQSAISLSLQAPVRTPLRVGGLDTEGGMEMAAEKMGVTGTAAAARVELPQGARRARVKRGVRVSTSTRAADARARRARAVGGLGGPPGAARAAATVVKAAATAAIKIAVIPVARAVAASPVKSPSSKTVVSSVARNVAVPVVKAPTAPAAPKTVESAVRAAVPTQTEPSTAVATPQQAAVAPTKEQASPVPTGTGAVKAVLTSPVAPARSASEPTTGARVAPVAVKPAATMAATAAPHQKRSVADRVFAPFRSRTQPAAAAAPAPISLPPVSSSVTEEIAAKYRGWRFVRKRALPKPVGMYSTPDGQPRSVAAAATTSLFVSSGLTWGGWRSNHVALASGGAATGQSNRSVADVAVATAASAAAAIPEAASKVATSFNAAAAEAVAAFPSAAQAAAAGIPAAATKAAANTTRTFSNGDLSLRGWRFSGYSKWRDDAAAEAQSMSALPTKAAAPAGAVQLAAAAAVAKVRMEAASRPPPPKPHRSWSRSEWLSSTLASQAKNDTPVPTNAYVPPMTRRRGGRLDRIKVPPVTKPYENDYLVREI